MTIESFLDIRNLWVFVPLLPVELSSVRVLAGGAAEETMNLNVVIRWNSEDCLQCIIVDDGRSITVLAYGAGDPFPAARD
jgi:hypothetical protein